MTNTPPPATALTAAELSAPDALLLPYQQRYLMDQSRLIVIEKSRRVGASYSLGAKAVIEAASGSQDVWYLAYSEDGAKEWIRAAAEWAEMLHVSAKASDVDLVVYDDEGKPETIRMLGLVFPGSSKRINALASNPRSLRGKAGLVIIDEAAYHDDLAEVLKAAIAFLMWGGEVIILSTHHGTDNPFAQLCDDIRDGKKPGYSLHRTTITTALEEGLYKRICLTRGLVWSPEAEAKWLADLEADYGADEAQEELHVIPTGSGESYFSRALIDSCSTDAPVLRYTQTDAFMAALSEAERNADIEAWLKREAKPVLDRAKLADPNRCFGLGVDVGRVADLTVIWPLGIAQNLMKQTPLVLELRNTPFNQQWVALRYVMRALPSLTFTCVDAGGNGSWLAEQAWIEGGGRDDSVERVQLSVGYYRGNLPALKKSFEERLLQIPRDLDIRADLAAVRRIGGVPRVPDVRQAAQTGGGRRHAEAAIALLLAHAACVKAEDIFVRWRALATL